MASSTDEGAELVRNPDNAALGQAALGLTWAFTALCIVIVAARFYVRSKITSSVGSDDWCMLAALICRIGTQAATQKMYDYNLGSGDEFVTIDQLSNIYMFNVIQTVISIPTSILARISATILLVRIFDRQRWLKWYLITFTGVMTILSIVSIITFCAQCRPLAAFWNPRIRGTCFDITIILCISLVRQCLFTISDLTYVLFPVMIIWKLHMPLNQKIGLTAMMMLSLLTVAASIVKTMAVLILTAPGDGTEWWSNPSALVMSGGAEQAAVIILGCLPPLLSVSKTGCARLRNAVSLSWNHLNRRAELRSFGHFPGNNLEPDPRSVDHGECDRTDKAPNTTLSSSGNGSDLDLQRRMDIWRTDSYLVAYEPDSSRMKAKESVKDEGNWV